MSRHKPGGLIQRELEPRRKLHGTEHAQAVVAERGRIDHAEKPSFDVAAAVAWIEIFLRQWIPGDRVDREVAPPHGFVQLHGGIAGDVEAAVPTARLGFPPRQRDVDIAGLVDLKAFADGLHAAKGFEEAPESIGRNAEDLDVDIFGNIVGVFSECHDPIAHPAAHNQRAAAGFAHRLGDAVSMMQGGPFRARRKRRVRSTRPTHLWSPDRTRPACDRTF